MNTPHGDLPHPTKTQKAAYYLLILFVLGMGVYFLVQGFSQF